MHNAFLAGDFGIAMIQAIVTGLEEDKLADEQR
jgi:hypothetical protein